ncbi:MAG: discoidin domain-containing protein [Propionibacteriaceae bacterium]|jgi:hypothetical protein|nr:discoidin domain-containing protein [Propionibacteriaceae bacterium]
MAEYSTLALAAAALADPRTPGEDLALIAQTYPTLWISVASHPNAYPGLLAWLEQYGDAAVHQVVAARRAQPGATTIAVPATPVARTRPARRRGLVLLILAAAALVTAVVLVTVFVLVPTFRPPASHGPTAQTTRTAGTSPRTPTVTAGPAGAATSTGPVTTPAPIATPSAQPKPPQFASVSASSTREPIGEFTYTPAMARDGNLSTAWVEGAPGPGVGEWILLSATTPQHVSGVTIYNGYLKSQAVYDTNNSVQKIRITFSDGTSTDQDLAQSASWNGDRITFPKPVDTLYLKFTIVSAYSRDNGEDTCISDIDVF